ncbi:TIGR00341 family protein [Halarsenatibacter silvermanii]|uniref:TIGR00341 family protein n=1 Tax=Halarsenatibacter silvermanii TaxID=321763 RepID=A0A1G9KLG1_9FIRM|nr:TIGR00341 family protein [Halarsenatibacter silvermanii]SDL50571.1 TIGR00341 family protein [Halarsenatibacter silvermanii]
MLRKVEIVVPLDKEERLKNILESFELVDKLQVSLWEDKALYLITLPAEDSGPLLDEIEQNLASASGFRLNVIKVEATLPEIEEEERPEKASEDKARNSSSTKSLSRQELYTEIDNSVGLNRNYLLMCSLSAVVATSGVLQGNVAVIIGAMVIAPLLGPNVGLALASTLGDIKLGKKSLITSFVGVLLAVLISSLAGFLLQPSEWSMEVLSRTNLGWGDVALGLASGSAGSLAFTTGAANAVIGVMIAVALMPPLVVFGLLLGAGESTLALGAFLLFISNVICINLGGVVTFLFQGIAPLDWWEKEKARRLTRYSLALWLGLLFLLLIIIFFIF